ncbi:hypothetical protein [Paraburkholderia flava]|uniref:hypothetical protein n=1 Tax=Paraburkholderia flava TaxID=2547393 RepID=UPI001061DFE2|nr:hypothetical protein [Paraburkholderia flava]
MKNLIRIGVCGVLLAGLGALTPAFAQTEVNVSSTLDAGNCRAVSGQAEIDGTTQQIVGRACQQSNGTWQIVQTDDGNVLWYPAGAYPYADPWWYGPPLFIGAGVGFIFVDRFHHFHRFYHYNHFHQFGYHHFGASAMGGFHHGFGGGHRR